MAFAFSSTHRSAGGRHEERHVDERTTVEELKGRVRTFCEDREWDPFHGPKDVAIGIITEASELLEEFRFFDAAECDCRLRDPAKRERIEDELADVFFFALRFAQRFDVDVARALERKLAKSAVKYPIEKARGSNLKYTEL